MSDCVKLTTCTFTAEEMNDERFEGYSESAIIRTLLLEKVMREVSLFPVVPHTNAGHIKAALRFGAALRSIGPSIPDEIANMYIPDIENDAWVAGRECPAQTDIDAHYHMVMNIASKERRVDPLTGLKGVLTEQEEELKKFHSDEFFRIRRNLCECSHAKK